MSKIDYNLNQIKAVVFDIDGVLSPTCVPMNDNGMPQRMANLRDGYAIQLAVRKGIKIAIITGAQDPAIKRRFNALGVTDIYMTMGQKSEILRYWMSRNGLRPQEVAYVGDDIPDYECMSIVGLPVAPRDAAHEIKSIAHYITLAEGGRGVGRELLEQVLRAQDNWPIKSAANGL